MLVTFVRSSLNPCGDNASAGEGHCYLTFYVVLFLIRSIWEQVSNRYDAKNDADAEDTHPCWNTQSLHHLRNDQNLFVVYFSASPLIFRCKFCIPLGTSFELLRLLFRRYFSHWLFVLRLIFQRYLALHSLWNDFWAENLHCAPLGTTFCSFGETCTAIFSSAFP
jgi:hypothetical protein